MDQVHFHPRRLGHVNLYVSQLERSIEFYRDTCGIELVRIEAAIRGGFHSNGNTHHDVGLIEVSKGVDRRGRDGNVQIAATRGAQVGLNHLAWEMETEVQLVEAYKRLRAAGLAVDRPSDHIISRSIYLPDPDGNVHEFYADAIPDWRSVFNLDHDDLVTSAWDPLRTPPSTNRYFPVDPQIREVGAAPLHPSHITGAAIATAHFDTMRDFFTEVAGLSLHTEIAGAARSAVFAGSLGNPDLLLMEVGEKDPIGLRRFAFRLLRETDVSDAVSKLRTILSMRVVDDSERRSILLSDPDGFQLEFYWARRSKHVPALAA